MASTASQAIHKAKTSSPFSFLPRLLRLALLVAADSFVIWFLLRLLDVLPHRGGAESASRLAADTRGTGSTHGQEVAIPARQSNELDDPQERALVDRLIRLGERTAETLMTPRTRIAWLDLTAPREENLQVLRENPYSRYPVYRGTDNDVVGILETRALARLLQLLAVGLVLWVQVNRELIALSSLVPALLARIDITEE
mgnify:CR=1 FL=1